jgi:hypothetical protein
MIELASVVKVGHATSFRSIVSPANTNAVVFVVVVVVVVAVISGQEGGK